jgi:putative copper resistance protein D
VLCGSAAFLFLCARPLQRIFPDDPHVNTSSLRILARSGWVLCAVALLMVTLNALVLRASLELAFADIASARFVLSGTLQAICAAAAALIAARPASDRQAAALAVLALLVLGASVATTHAAARPELQLSLLTATALHQAGAALWLGGLPCFYAALRVLASERAGRAWLGRRYSGVSILGVALIVAGALVLALGLIASWEGLYGTPYGAMAATKMFLLGVLLLIGLANFTIVRRFSAGETHVGRVRRFVEIEIALGIAVFALAASMTSAPPAVDLPDDRVGLDTLAARFTPRPPRLETPDASSLAIATLQRRLDEEAARTGAGNRAHAFVPGAGELPPRNASDIAWSEYNHHWAGLLVLAIGICALAERSGRARWTRHWPLLFLGLAVFILLRADPEVWPLGTIGLVESLRDPEVVQHRLFAVMTAAFAAFEWRVRTGRFRSQRPAFVFPLVMIAGGVLLLAHSHAISDVKEQVLIEWSHLPLGVLGVLGGAARWMQLRGAGTEARWAGWIWPACLVLTGLVLLGYREA